MPHKDPEKRRAYKASDNARRYVGRHISKFSLVQELGGRCLRCGEDNPLLLDFHHKDQSTKEGTIGRMLQFASKYEEAKKEAQKCVLLCANCHRKEHNEHSWLMNFPGSKLYICPWEHSCTRKEKTKVQKEREMEKFIDTQLNYPAPYLT
jgi:hypothetical protein